MLMTLIPMSVQGSGFVKILVAHRLQLISVDKIAMSFGGRLKQAWGRLKQNPQFQNMWSSPVSKIVAINTAVFLMWRFKVIPQQFMVRHFSFERYNMRDNRIYTMLTYAFSHVGFFSFLINMVVIGSFGRGIRMQYGNKIVWGLYIAGALTGGLAMNFFMPQLPAIVPQVGADAPLTAMITFYGMNNLQNQVLFFFFPMRMWVLLGFMGAYCLMEPSKRSLGGMLAGAMVFQLFKLRII